MARIIEFDAKEVINVAMQTFWDRGLKTTLSDLEASTGLNRSSIYNTFGNKDEVFRLVMNCYVEFLEDWINQAYDHLPFKAFLKTLLEDAATDNFGGRGCFFYKCLGTLSLKNKKVLDAAYLNMRNIFEKRILAAQELEELDPNINAPAYATLLMVTISVLRAFNLSGFPKEDLQKAAAAGLVLLS